jgi:hypothetical protein
MDLMSTAQLLGSFGEFVGAIAVVATLFYLAVQVRHSKEATESNTKAVERASRLAEAAAFDEHDRRLNDVSELVIRNESVARFMLKARQGEELTPEEALRFRNFVGMWLRNNQSSYLRAKMTGQSKLMDYMTTLVGQLIADGPALYREVWEETIKPRGLALDQQDYVDAVEDGIASRTGETAEGT